VVIFLIDDWGHNDLGTVNKDNENYIQTPFLDSAAKAGVWFTDAYVQPICSPTRSQLLSGRYQIHTGERGPSVVQLPRRPGRGQACSGGAGPGCPCSRRVTEVQCLIPPTSQACSTG